MDNPSSCAVNDPWRGLLKIASATSILAILLTLSDIILGTALSATLAKIDHSSAGLLQLLHDQFWLGLYQLDFLNMIVTLLMIPVYLAFCIMLWDELRQLSLLTMVLFLLGAILFLVNNAALPMAELSRQAFTDSAAGNAQNYFTAGEALLAKGAHGSIGAFPGFFLQTLASIFLSYMMLRSQSFGKAIGLFGLVGSILLLVYLALVTFIPGMLSIAMVIAAPGGLLALVWMVLYTRKLLSWSR